MNRKKREIVENGVKFVKFNLDSIVKYKAKNKVRWKPKRGNA